MSDNNNLDAAVERTSSVDAHNYVNDLNTIANGQRGVGWIRGALIKGNVYLGMNAGTGELMAVKQLGLPAAGDNDPNINNELNALKREINMLKDLRHDNIVKYLDSSTEQSAFNIFLEYVSGGSLDSLLQNYGSFEEELCRGFVQHLLRGLEYLHERDVVHGAINDKNVLIGSAGRARISPFGVAFKKAEAALLDVSVGQSRGYKDPIYWTAPEILRGNTYSSKADIWSVGCVCVEMTTGKHPWEPLDQMQAAYKLGTGAMPPFPPDLSSEIVDFLRLTFELDCAKRSSANELLRHPWILAQAQ